MPKQPPTRRLPRAPRRGAVAVIMAAGAAAAALPVAGAVSRNASTAPAPLRADPPGAALSARVAAVRAAASAPDGSHARSPWPVAAAANWTNWPKWSKWSNWANK